MCLYDVLTHYSVRRVTAGEKRETQIAWVVGHPARGHLRMVKSKRGKERVPCINYLDFLDTKEFGGNKIDSCDLSLCSVWLNLRQWKCMQKKRVPSCEEKKQIIIS